MSSPYVLNDQYFVNSPQKYIYYDSRLYLFRLINTWSVVLIGLSLSCFVFYLIMNKSPYHFYPFRKMLILSAAVDTYMLCQIAMVQTRQKNASGTALITFTGILPSIFGYFIFCPLIVLQSGLALFALSVIPVQFYYRFYTVKNDRSPSVLQTISWFLFSLSFCAIPAYFTWDMFCPAERNVERIDYGPLWHSEVPIPQLLAWSSIKGPNFTYKQAMSPLLLFSYYLISLWFARKTVKVLDEKYSSIGINSSVRKAQKQLSRTLFAQSLVPLIFSIIPRIIPVLVTHLKLETDYGGEIVNAVSAYYPIFNLLSTIGFIEPYRKFLMGFCPFSKHYRFKHGISGIQSSIQILQQKRVSVSVIKR